jgi:hypothetical protein
MSERHTASAGRAKAQFSPEKELGVRPDGHGGPASRPSHTPLDLTLCPCCDRDLVYPVDWEPAGARGWSISLRCPECEWTSEGVFDQETADRFDDALDDSTQAVLDDLQLLIRSNMEADVERFIRALEADLIVPEDF